ncbi:MAG: di-heme oxidoredictase family protein, partial [Myxococcota bacterium]
MGRWSVFAWVVMVAVGCSDGEDPVPLAEGVFGALGTVRPNATDEERAMFDRGLEVALRRFKPSDGLGPRFNLVFCGGCHEKPAFGGSGPRYRNFLLTGQRLSDGSFAGTGVNGVQVQFEPGDRIRMPTDPATNVQATRNPIPFFGVGLLAELPNEAILVNADPDDADGDGISGRPNYDRGFVGRFGRKSQTVSTEGFIRGPLFNHMGLTSNPLPDARKNELPVPSGTALRRAVTTASFGQTVREQAAAPDEPTVDDDGVPDPELSEQDLFDLIAYTMLLAAPQPEPLGGASLRGSELFEGANCTGCHVPSLIGPRGRIPLYSDLLLHDMGPELADGIEMKLATGAEFRTQPLWGVAATGPYLHDGRADTLHEAIVAHGGEAQASADVYRAMSSAEQADVRAFLLSLGGRDQMSEGLIPPDEATPAVGEWGGPEPTMSVAQFEEGRRVFDRDVPAAAGMGPLFNGDSCRACHFEPVFGGAGPIGVNVIRHGYVDAEGTFTAAVEGTVAHRLALDGQVRPPLSANVNLFELRQTPALFGLGRLMAVPEADILAWEDPADADDDGIRGVAHRLPDGRLGRFGWRADVPSLAEFARDALSAELGVTVPDQPGLTYGVSVDDDEVADPEFSMADLQRLVFYLNGLGPPPLDSTEPQAEARGAIVFEEVGCAGCHRPSLPDGQGGTVDAYTDLLLHDVQAPDHQGVPSFAANGRQYRTAPLWGIRATAPYWHDGHAETL